MLDIKEIKILDQTQSGYYEVDLDGNLTYVNDMFCRITRVTPDQVSGLGYHQFSSPETLKKIHDTYRQVYLSGIPQQIEYELILNDGSRIIFEVTVNLTMDAQGRKTGFNGILTDITDRKRLEESLLGSKQRYEELFESANEFILTTDTSGNISRVNRMVEEISGYERSELIGKTILTIAHPEDKELFFRFWQDILNGKEPRYSLRAINKEGLVVVLLASGSAIREGGRITEIQYNAQIITDLRKAQEIIVDLKNHLKSVIESSPNMIICLDNMGCLEIINPVTERILRVSAVSLTGRRLSDMFPQLQNLDALIDKVIQDRMPCTLPEETLPDGNMYSITIYPLANTHNGGVVLTAIDITEKKRMENELIQAQKLETIGLLAGGIAHDFNNILMGITGNISMMRLTDDPQKYLKYIERMESFTTRAKELISQMLMFSRKRVGSPRSFAADKVIQEVMDISSMTIPKNIRMEAGGLDKTHTLYMDYTQMTQVLLNLIVNARDAIGDRQDGFIRISTQILWVDEKDQRSWGLESPGRYLRIDIIDNGGGIEKEYIPKIFDPFFTTKSKDVGTGLGLAITYSIIKNSGGSVQVYSEKGQGTKFSIVLPLGEELSAVSSPAVQAVAYKSKIFRVLLVDDEAMLRDIGQEMLEALGHTVLSAANGFECLEILQRERERIDVVILDMIMPGLDGRHTLEEMIRQGMQHRVIISSGFYHEDEMQGVMTSSLVVARLNKPFSIQELSQVLSGIA